ncbi:hypothetical protein MJO28_009967 [Puccinia striiformis f. sp. tritici]|uniref:Uncharacterized protein n=1 Tax=Puccinia striiformis f. sp. tritici TaxID=168172 RepID=A0ACC0E8Q6_9BASI|nr:hypothetical protein MJO28_009967 [Puccinia striiformis f. sp. tritici]
MLQEWNMSSTIDSAFSSRSFPPIRVEKRKVRASYTRRVLQREANSAQKYLLFTNASRIEIEQGKKS